MYCSYNKPGPAILLTVNKPDEVIIILIHLLKYFIILVTAVAAVLSRDCPVILLMDRF